MKKSWKIIGIAILTVFLLGLVCMGVGVLTGADYSRIFTVVDEKFQIESTLSLYSQYFKQVNELFLELFA